MIASPNLERAGNRVRVRLEAFERRFGLVELRRACLGDRRCGKLDGYI